MVRCEMCEVLWTYGAKRLRRRCIEVGREELCKAVR
jgi:hypothetical protein